MAYPVIKIAEVREIVGKPNKKGGPGGGDPTYSGGVRLQVYNEENDLKDDELKLGTVMHPITSAATAGVGIFPHGLIVGSRVICMFLPWDKACQYPIVLGSLGRGDLPTVGGINKEPDRDTGGEIKNIAPDVPGGDPPYKIA